MKNYLLGGDIREILSQFFGDKERIPFSGAWHSEKNISATWEIPATECEGHFDTLPGARLLEASAQAAAVLVKALGMFDGRLPMLEGGDSFDFKHSAIAGDDVVFLVEILDLKGKRGSVNAFVEVNGQRIAEFLRLRFRAHRIGALERLKKKAA